MVVKKAVKKDAKHLTELSIRSKSYWNYEKEQVSSWIEELTITKDYIASNHLYKLIINDTLIGFYSYFPENKTNVNLNHLFVEPQHIGKGYGKFLMNDFFKRIRTTDFEKVILYADPNTEKFYSKLGFNTVGKLKSAIKNRFLPIMELCINPNHKIF